MHTTPLKITTALLVVTGLAVPGSASAQLSGPTLISPINGKSQKARTPFTFKAKAPAGASVYLKVSKSKKVGADGTLLGSNLYFRKMGFKNGFFQKKTESYGALSTYFLNRPGTYYWQAYLIDCSDDLDDCNIESKIQKFKVK
jgi:hypothetical protein